MTVAPPPPPDWQRTVDSYLEMLRVGHRAEALRLVRRLRDDGHTSPEIMQRVLGPAQRQVGLSWVADAWSVAQEHAATAISEAVLHALAADLDEVPASSSQTRPVVVSCVEQEWHALPALMVAEHLRGAGLPVSYLGANASSQHLVRHIHELGPRAVLLSCSLSGTLPLVRRQIEAVRETGTPVVVGGAAFDAGGRRARSLGATAYAADGVGAADVVRELPDAVPPAPALIHAGATEAFVIFGERERLADQATRGLLDALARATADRDEETTEGLPTRTADWWRAVLEDQMPYLVGAVAGALVCEDPSIIAESLAWAETVLRHRDAPQGVGPALRSSLHDALHDMPTAASLLRQRAGA
jgi:methanogenic corrinoid protein MtbC1